MCVHSHDYINFFSRKVGGRRESLKIKNSLYVYRAARADYSNATKMLIKAGHFTGWAGSTLRFNCVRRTSIF